MNQDSIHIDLSQVPDSSVVPAGLYPVEVAKAELGQSQSGNPMMTVNFNIIDGDHTGARLITWMSLQPQALFAVKGFLKALDIDTSGGVNLTPAEYIGRTLCVKVTVAKDNDGEERNNCRAFKPLSEYEG
jgi:hypothetical protein